MVHNVINPAADRLGASGFSRYAAAADARSWAAVLGPFAELG